MDYNDSGLTDFERTTFRTPTEVFGTPYEGSSGILKPNHFGCNLLNGLPAGLEVPPRPHPGARSGHFIGFSTTLKKVYLYGGMGLSRSQTQFNDVWVYCPDTTLWSQMSTSGDLPTGGFGFAACLVNNDTSLFIHGGMSTSLLEEAHLLDLRTGHWTNLGSTLGRRWGHSASVIHRDGDELVVLALGDMSTRDSSNEVTTYSISTGAVVTKDCGPDPDFIPVPRRRHAAGVVFNDFLLIFGGRSAMIVGRSFYNDLWVLNMVTWRWCQLTSSVSPSTLRRYYQNPNDGSIAEEVREEGSRRVDQDSLGPLRSRTGATATVIGTSFYTFGGFGASAVSLYTLQSLMRYNVLLNSWTTMLSGLGGAVNSEPIQNPHRMPPPITMAAMCWVPSNDPDAANLFLHGGRWRDDPIKLHYQLVVPRMESLRHFAAYFFLSTREEKKIKGDIPPAVAKFIAHLKLSHQVPEHVEIEEE